MSGEKDPRLGTLLDARYRVIERLGSGGAGVVYRARHEEMARDVAVKVLHPELVAGGAAFERFRREARAAAALSHPHVVTVHDFRRAESGEAFLVMEYCEGGSLADRIVREGRPPLAEVARLVAEAASAIDAAHAAGIVHRDLKPANLLLARGQVRVADFGLAKIFAGEDPQLTGSRAIGSPLYMSPEQCQGVPAGPPSDIYSLGAVAYELLVGAPPFPGENVQAILAAHLLRQPTAPADMVPGLPPRASRAVLAALAKEADARPESATELARQLALAAEEAGAAALTADGWTPAVPLRRAGRSSRERSGSLPAEPIGRAAELAALAEAAAMAAAGEGRLVTIAGEPGTGKSTLVASFLARTRAELPEAWVALGRTAEHFASAEPYSPFLDALAELLRGPRGAELGAALEDVAPTWAAHFPTLRGGDSREQGIDGLRSRDRMPRELAALVARLGETSATVVALEDLHWADPATVDLLSFLVPRLDSLPLLLVVTYRPADIEVARHPLLALLRVLGQGNQAWTEIAPAPMGRVEAEALLARELGAEPPRELVDFALRRTEGNPLFLISLLAHLQSTGALVRRDGAFTLLRSVPSIEESLPEGIAAVIQQKLERLEAGDRRLLAAASVVGESFDAALVAHLVDAEEVDVEDALRRLGSRHKLLAPEGEAELADGGASSRYRFVHSLFRHAFYDDLAPKRREVWHRRAAEELERRHAADRTPWLPQLAVHWERGRDPRRAIERNLEAADVAARRNPKDARPALEKALELAGRLPDGEAPAVRARLLVRLGRHDAETAEFVGNVSLYERAEAAVSEALTLEPGSLEARTILGLIHLERGENERAFVDFARVLALDADHAPAWDGLSYLFKNTGFWNAALAAQRRAARHDAAYAHSIRRLSVLIYLDRDREAVEEAEALVARRPRFAHYNYWRGIASLYAGDRAEGRRWIEQGFDLDPDDPIARGVLAFALAADGEAERARPLLESAEPGAAADGTFTYWVAKVHALLGDSEAALEWLDRALALGYWDAPWMRKDFAVRALDGHPGFAARLATADARRAALGRRIRAEASADLVATLGL